MELLFDPEEKIQCPYNPSHHIMRRRMNTHLVKCKENYPESKMVECDFNVNHKVPEPELQYHHENCPDRRKVEHTIYQEEGVVLDKFPVQNIHVDAEDNWDDCNVVSYDPNKYCEENEIIRRMDVASAAQRKNFRLGERNRINQISNNKPVQQVEAQVNSRSSSVASRRNLPERPSGTVEEGIPDTIADLTKRVHLGKNKSYIPKQK